jgi:hypothetical protein
MQRILTSLVNLDALFFLSIVQSMKQQYALKCALLFLVWLPCCLPNFHVHWCGGVLFLMDSIKHADISLLFICSVVFQTALGQGIHGLCLTLHTRCLIICLPPTHLQCAEFWLQHIVAKLNQDIVPCG